MRHLKVPQSIGLSFVLAIGLLAAPFAPAVPSAAAREGNKTIKLYFGHTKERGEFTFKRNGRYDKRELDRINRLLRDWRKNEPAKMDPQLLDLIWAIHRETGSREYIHVVSAYRSLATNNMLRSRSRGVAKTSQHTAGKAMDFYIPGVPLAKLRGIAMKFQGGGVGYYPTSGSPFVHVDTGNVRSWPRMSRQQLLALFPNGETLYLPTDGKPLAGYERALARRKSSGGTALAYLENGDEGGGAGKKGTMGGWLKRVFDNGADEAEDAETAATSAPAAAPAAPVPAAPAATPPSEPAVGDPTVLIAELDADGPRTPRSRPPTETERMLALLPPELAAPAEPATVRPPVAVAEPAQLAFAPLPRTRPDAALLATSLESGASASGSLAVEAEDAIAALAAHADAVAPAGTQTAVAVAERAVLPAPAATALAPAGAAAGETALAAANALAAAATTEPVPLPRARPLALAFAGSGPPAAQPAEGRAQPEITVAMAAPPPQPTPAAPPAAKSDMITVAPEPAYDADDWDLRQLIGKAEPPPPPPAEGLTMPQPAGAAGLFVAPESAAAVTEIAKRPAPPARSFKVSEAKAPPAEEGSFFANLFTSLTN